jgi:abortive infection bacteriophage resistance protein
MKQATTVQEQIEKLKERGLLLDMDEKKTKEILNDIGYFRLGFYCFPFEKNYPNKERRTHEYKEGSKFSDVVHLYYLDVDLRNILSRYINRIEINFRTTIIYQVSNQYKNCSTWFIDPSVMEKKFIDDFDNKLYTDTFRRNPIIKNHHAKYINDKYAPAWKTLEFFTFGTMVNIYKNIKENDLKQKIAACYNIHNEKTFANYFNAIVEIRNICAHGNTLFDHALARQLKKGPAVVPVTTSNAHKPYSAIQIIAYILKSISINRANDMQKEINTIFNNHKKNKIIYCIINNCIGYPNNS